MWLVGLIQAQPANAADTPVTFTDSRGGPTWCAARSHRPPAPGDSGVRPVPSPRARLGRRCEHLSPRPGGVTNAESAAICYGEYRIDHGV
jgi:hypothetical protein